MKKLSVLLIAAMLFAACFVSPVSAADAKTGFYNIGTADGVTITAAASSGTVTEVKDDVDGDKTEDVLYNGSDKLTVKYDKATAEKFYMVWLVAGTELPKSKAEESVYYVNQQTATGTSVEFNVFPKEIKETTKMTLFITSDDGKANISVPVSFLADAAVAFVKGDINNDGVVNAKDVTLFRRYLADKTKNALDATQLLAADINEDGKQDAKDVTLLRRYLSDKDKYPLP